MANGLQEFTSQVAAGDFAVQGRSARSPEAEQIFHQANEAQKITSQLNLQAQQELERYGADAGAEVQIYEQAPDGTTRLRPLAQLTAMNFGAGRAYNQALLRNYGRAVETEARGTFGRLQTQYANSPGEFTAATEAYIAQTVEGMPDSSRGTIGTQLRALSTTFAAQIAERQQAGARQQIFATASLGAQNQGEDLSRLSASDPFSPRLPEMLQRYNQTLRDLQVEHPDRVDDLVRQRLMRDTLVTIEGNRVGNAAAAAFRRGGLAAGQAVVDQFRATGEMSFDPDTFQPRTPAPATTAPRPGAAGQPAARPAAAPGAPATPPGGGPAAAAGQPGAAPAAGGSIAAYTTAERHAIANLGRGVVNDLHARRENILAAGRAAENDAASQATTRIGLAVAGLSPGDPRYLELVQAGLAPLRGSVRDRVRLQMEAPVYRHRMAVEEQRVNQTAQREQADADARQVASNRAYIDGLQRAITQAYERNEPNTFNRDWIRENVREADRPALYQHLDRVEAAASARVTEMGNEQETRIVREGRLEMAQHQPGTPERAAIIERITRGMNPDARSRVLNQLQLPEEEYRRTEERRAAAEAPREAERVATEETNERIRRARASLADLPLLNTRERDNAITLASEGLTGRQLSIFNDAVTVREHERRTEATVATEARAEADVAATTRQTDAAAKAREQAANDREMNRAIEEERRAGNQVLESKLARHMLDVIDANMRARPGEEVPYPESYINMHVAPHHRAQALAELYRVRRERERTTLEDEARAGRVANARVGQGTVSQEDINKNAERLYPRNPEDPNGARRPANPRDPAELAHATRIASDTGRVPADLRALLDRGLSAGGTIADAQLAATAFGQMTGDPATRTRIRQELGAELSQRLDDLTYDVAKIQPRNSPEVVGRDGQVDANAQANLWNEIRTRRATAADMTTEQFNSRARIVYGPNFEEAILGDIQASIAAQPGEATRSPGHWGLGNPLLPFIPTSLFAQRPGDVMPTGQPAMAPIPGLPNALQWINAPAVRQFLSGEGVVPVDMSRDELTSGYWQRYREGVRLQLSRGVTDREAVRRGAHEYAGDFWQPTYFGSDDPRRAIITMGSIERAGQRAGLNAGQVLERIVESAYGLQLAAERSGTRLAVGNYDNLVQAVLEKDIIVRTLPGSQGNPTWVLAVRAGPGQPHIDQTRPADAPVPPGGIDVRNLYGFQLRPEAATVEARAAQDAIVREAITRVNAIAPGLSGAARDLALMQMRVQLRVRRDMGLPPLPPPGGRTEVIEGSALGSLVGGGIMP